MRILRCALSARAASASEIRKRIDANQIILILPRIAVGQRRVEFSWREARSTFPVKIDNAE